MLPSFAAVPAFAYANVCPAGPVDTDAGHHTTTATKATIGLGLGLPTKILHTSLAQSKAKSSTPVGLGIYIPDFDLSFSSGGTITTSSCSSASSTTTTSTGMLGTRLPRRRMPLLPSPTFTDSDYAPMRTPSPSLRGELKKTPYPGVLFAFVAPNVPELELIGSDDEEEEFIFEEEEEEEEEVGWGLPSTESISSGLDLLCLSDEELMERYIPSGILDDNDDDDHYHLYNSKAIGLGLSLAELDGPKLVLTLREHGFRDSYTNLPLSANTTTPTTTTSSLSSISPSSSFYDSLFSVSDLDEDEAQVHHHPSPYLLPRTAESSMAHLKPCRAQVYVGFSLEDGSPVIHTTESIDEEEEEEGPTLGFESPEFWERYLDVLYGR